ncbi:unnamed protein product [Lymnaea stagnalis]|uniref:Complement component 1 Q subcomponent-binding protein, mitochondrial n=1 Tax=Lymnaea stagnalis TaxID=6523 RepID=A0AAV2H4X3_LYMST
MQYLSEHIVVGLIQNLSNKKKNMAKALKLAINATSKILSNGSTVVFTAQKHSGRGLRQYVSKFNDSVFTPAASRTHCTLSALSRSILHTKSCKCMACMKTSVATYSTEVDKEISKFLDKEISYEKSRATSSLPAIPGFEIQTDGGDVTLTKLSGKEKIVVRLSVNGSVDSIMSDSPTEKEDEPPQMICRPPFEVEISKGDGTVFALQCSFPAQEHDFEDASQYAKGQQAEQIDDQFEIQEVAIHGGEWKDTTFSVSAATMDAELFDLLMDMLDERGINDEFIVQLVDFCTAYENKQYIGFLQNLKAFAEK